MLSANRYVYFLDQVLCVINTMILPSYLVYLASMVNGKSSLNDQLLHILSYFREIDPYDVFFLVPYETSQYSNMFPNKMVEHLIYVLLYGYSVSLFSPCNWSIFGP